MWPSNGSTGIQPIKLSAVLSNWIVQNPHFLNITVKEVNPKKILGNHFPIYTKLSHNCQSGGSWVPQRGWGANSRSGCDNLLFGNIFAKNCTKRKNLDRGIHNLNLPFGSATEYYIIITARKRSCGKVMFLHLSVSLSASVRAGIHPLGRHPSPADGHCSGRYASYWNAFLFQ